MGQPIIDIDDAWGHKIERDNWTVEGVSNGWERVPLSNPLGFQHHPLEGAVFFSEIFKNSKELINLIIYYLAYVDVSFDDLNCLFSMNLPRPFTIQ